MAKIHKRAKEELNAIILGQRSRSEALIAKLADVLAIVAENLPDAELGRRIRQRVAPGNDLERLREECAGVSDQLSDPVLAQSQTQCTASSSWTITSPRNGGSVGFNAAAGLGKFGAAKTGWYGGGPFFSSNTGPNEGTFTTDSQR